MKKTLFMTSIALMVSIGIRTNAQNGAAINTSGLAPDNSAILDISSGRANAS